MRVMVAVCVVMIAGASALAQEDAAWHPSKYIEDGTLSPPGLPGGNAALEWFRLWDRFDSRQWSVMQAGGGWWHLGEGVTPKQAEFIESHGDFLDAASKLAAMTQCVWGAVRGARGECFGAELVYLRPTGNLLLMDAVRKANDHAPAAAAERVCAAIGVCRQFSTGESEFTANCAGWMCCNTCGTVEGLLDKALLTRAGAAKVLAAFQSLPKDDPFNVFAGVRADAEASLAWWKGEVARGHMTMAHIFGWAGELESDGIVVANPWPYTRERFASDVARYGEFVRRLSDALGTPLWDARVSELELEADEGQFGLLASIQRGPTEHYLRGTDPRNRAALRHTLARLADYTRPALSPKEPP